MSEPHDPFSFDVEYGDPNFVKSARDPNQPPQPGKEWKPNGRAADAEIVKGNGPAPFDDLDDDAGAGEAAADFEGFEATKEVEPDTPDDPFDEFEKAEAPAAEEGETVTLLIPDREVLLQFADLMFKNASPDGFVSLRAFRDNDRRDEKPILIEAIRLDDPDFAAILFERARQAATWHDPAVFCPPVATFQDHQNAKTDNLCEGVDLSVECDQSPHGSTLDARSPARSGYRRRRERRRMDEPRDRRDRAESASALAAEKADVHQGRT